MPARKRIRWNEGDVVAIDLDDGHLGFGRLLKRPLIAFYDLKSKATPTLEEITRQPILFKLYVMRHAITRGEWPAIGHRPLEPALKEEPYFFKQDPITTRLYLYQDIAPNGRSIPATLDQIQGLECAAAWEPSHVADRLNDHFANRPNKWVEVLRPKPVLSEKEQEERIKALRARYENLTTKKRATPTKKKTAKATTKRSKH